MNNIYELIEIIKQLGKETSFSSICDVYQKSHKLILSQNHKITIEKTLNENPKLVYLDQNDMMWKLADTKKQKNINTIIINDKFFGFDFNSKETLEKRDRARRLINEFKNKYPISSINSLTFDEYAIAAKDKGNNNSFCRTLRYDMQHICSMGDAFSTTFELYKKGGEIRFSQTYRKEFKNNFDLAFVTLKQRIVDFLQAAEKLDTNKMNEIKLNRAFKQKLAAVYFDDLYFPGAVKKYLQQSCARLGVVFDEDNVFNSMVELSNWKSNYPQIKNIENNTLMTYADFLIRNNLSMSSIKIDDNPYKDK